MGITRRNCKVRKQNLDKLKTDHSEAVEVILDKIVVNKSCVQASWNHILNEYTLYLDGSLDCRTGLDNEVFGQAPPGLDYGC